MPNIPKKQKQRPWITERKPFEGMDHSNQKFYESQAWKTARTKYLNAHPLCEKCQKDGIITEAKMVHHIKPIRKGGHPTKESNLMALCWPCHHNIKH